MYKQINWLHLIWNRDEFSDIHLENENLEWRKCSKQKYTIPVSGDTSAFWFSQPEQFPLWMN